MLSAVTLGIQDLTVPSGCTSISQSPSAKPTVSPVCVRPDHKNEATTQQEWPTLAGSLMCFRLNGFTTASYGKT